VLRAVSAALVVHFDQGSGLSPLRAHRRDCTRAGRVPDGSRQHLLEQIQRVLDGGHHKLWQRQPEWGVVRRFRGLSSPRRRVTAPHPTSWTAMGPHRLQRGRARGSSGRRGGEGKGGAPFGLRLAVGRGSPVHVVL